MSLSEILLDVKGYAISRIEINERIKAFGNSYSDATKEIINKSKDLDHRSQVKDNLILSR
jgi:hypothetical protein